MISDLRCRQTLLDDRCRDYSIWTVGNNVSATISEKLILKLKRIGKPDRRPTAYWVRFKKNKPLIATAPCVAETTGTPLWSDRRTSTFLRTEWSGGGCRYESAEHRIARVASPSVVGLLRTERGSRRRATGSHSARVGTIELPGRDVTDDGVREPKHVARRYLRTWCCRGTTTRADAGQTIITTSRAQSIISPPITDGENVWVKYPFGAATKTSVPSTGHNHFNHFMLNANRIRWRALVAVGPRNFVQAISYDF